MPLWLQHRRSPDSLPKTSQDCPTSFQMLTYCIWYSNVGLYNLPFSPPVIDSKQYLQISPADQRCIHYAFPEISTPLLHLSQVAFRHVTPMLAHCHMQSASGLASGSYL